MLKKSKPIIGISTGDPNGIGIEVILKSLTDKSILDLCCVVLFSDFELIESQKSFFNIDLNLNAVDDFDLSELAGGIYFVKVYSSTQSTLKKIYVR